MSDELYADDIFGRGDQVINVNNLLDDELVFNEAEGLDNPLAIPLTAALRLIKRLRQWLQGERELRRQTVHELAKTTAQLDAARRTISVLRAEAKR